MQIPAGWCGSHAAGLGDGMTCPVAALKETGITLPVAPVGGFCRSTAADLQTIFCAQRTRDPASSWHGAPLTLCPRAILTCHSFQGPRTPQPAGPRPCRTPRGASAPSSPGRRRPTTAAAASTATSWRAARRARRRGGCWPRGEYVMGIVIVMVMVWARESGRVARTLRL